MLAHFALKKRGWHFKIKKDLKDPSNCLSPWVGKDCCNWKGIECDNQTGHVLKFELKPYLICNKTASIFSLSPFGGKINLSLADLKHLNYLDLSSNDFEGISIPEFIGSFSKLNYLNLSYANFSGMVPTHLGNLSNLHYLDIADPTATLCVRGLSWLSTLPSIQYLSMNFVNITDTPHELFGGVNMMPSLLELHLSSCNLVARLPSSPFLNISSLSVLDLSKNYFNSSIPSWFFNMSNLTELHLSDSSLIGPVPSMLGRWNFYKLQNLDMSSNYLTGDITEMIEALSCSNQSLVSLYLSNNQLTGKLPRSLGKFTSLYDLDLSRNSVNSHTGVSHPIPTSIGNLSNLGYLNLENNMMNGAIPESIDKLTNLHSLNLLENYWEGTVTNIHFHNLSNLFSFFVSSIKNTLALQVTNDWVPPFKDLHYVEIRSCQVGPTFPNWLRNLNQLNVIILVNPCQVGPTYPNWLRIVDLSNNMLEGGIPNSICSLPLLFILELSNNNLTADLSSIFQNCTQLKTLSLKYNRFYGSMPNEIANNIPMLAELLLRGNSITGSIPEELCHLPFLHLLDLAENRLSGSIPTWLGDVTGFKLPQTCFIFSMYSYTLSGYVPYTRHIELVVKGRIAEYTKQMPVHSIIDLSKNNLSGEIPENITQLIHLGALNLSWNRLTGDIPNNIGLLTDLESLDISHNHLSGAIPPSMASITFLGHLNLSYNNLSGRIPVANQFGTFDELSYVSNPGLCGHPLPTNCSSLSPRNGDQERKHDDGVDGDGDNERLGLDASIAIGYITGFWIVCGSLMLKRPWRHAYFNFVYDMRDKLLVLMAVTLARLKRRFGLERN